MAARAIWKGLLVVGELACPAALHAAASTADRVSFHLLNRKTGHRLRRLYVDAETGDPVEKDDQAKGYEKDGRTVILDADEIADAVPASDKRLDVEAFMPCDEVDTLYFDRPYYLTAGDGAEMAFAVIRTGLEKKKVAALARTVLFRRDRTLMVRPSGDNLVAHTLEYDHEVRHPATSFRSIPDRQLDPEMLDLARHIISKKRGRFDPETFEDRYDAALAELVAAKAAGRWIKRLPKPEPTRGSDLIEALRASAGRPRKAS